MDLGAYAKIEDLDQIAKDNGIDIPRLRGYRLMKDEAPVSRDEIKRMLDECAIEAVKELCQSEPFWSLHASYFVWDSYIDSLISYYTDTGVRWDRIHGKKRKILKYAIKKKKRAVQAQWDTWNRYAGKEGVLYVHSRMGGGNWKYYEDKDSIVKQPWFLERVDDWWDNTYCDFYCKVKT